jgi:transcriptional regulator with XRE-family HTH domain
VTDIGNSLREARIRRGLSIKDVENATKIRGKYLEALEQDDFEVLPGPTFAKAFLRTYAIALKLDADALVDEYRSRYERSSPDPTTPMRAEYVPTSRTRTSAERKKKRTRRSQRGYAVIGVVAVVIVVLLAWFGSGRGQEPASIEAGNIAQSTASAGAGSTTTVAGGGTASTDAGVTTTGPAGESPTTASATASTSATGTTGQTGGQSGSSNGGDVKLVVSVTEGSCWLVVREDSKDGAEVYAGTLSAGAEQTFDSSKRYWMMVGEPEALALSIDGVAYSLAAPAGSFVVTGAGVERSQ